MIKLVNDVAFREELLKFKINTDVQEEHRGPLLDILVRILYSKFQSKSVGGRSSKDTAHKRRTTIVNFFSALRPEECHYFTNLMMLSFLRAKHSCANSD